MHRLSEVNREARTAVCEECGPIHITKQGPARPGGSQRWRCGRGKTLVRGPKTVYRRYCADTCSAPGCTATILAPCQLDVHHIDGDHSNNDPSNLRTLCANCHRLLHRQPHLFALLKDESRP